MRKAFTLIELLVVVSIIALLVAILLPILSNVKHSTRTTICSTNLHQIGIGITSYTTDNDGFYPHKVGPTRDRYLNPLDGEYYRWDQKPWSIRSRSRWDYVSMVENYFNDLNESFLCPHVAADWDDDVYSQQTNATIIPYAFYWGITQSNANGAVRVPMRRIGEGWGPGRRTDGGGITEDSRYHVMASDYIRLGVSSGGVDSEGNPLDIANKIEGNHPPASGDYYYRKTANGNGTGYRYDDTTPGNNNYLYEDGSVELYGQIYKGQIGNNTELFRNAGSWLIPTDRVVN